MFSRKSWHEISKSSGPTRLILNFVLLASLGICLLNLGIVGLFDDSRDREHLQFGNPILTDQERQLRPAASSVLPFSRGLPPLSLMVQGWNVTGDVSWLLDFAVVGKFKF
jgi:hypothetical protein